MESSLLWPHFSNAMSLPVKLKQNKTRYTPTFGAITTANAGKNFTNLLLCGTS